MTEPDDRGDAETAVRDPVGTAAIICGCVGIVVLGVVLAIVTAVLATVAGQQAMRERRSMQNAYLGFALAALDGVMWIVLHIAFDLHFIAG